VTPSPRGTDIAVVVLAHQEGTLAHHTLRAIRRSVDAALEDGWSVRAVVVLDSPDDATRDYIAWAVGPDGLFVGPCEAVMVEVTTRDPGLARNAGVAAAADARFVAVLDGDNLPSRTWLAEGARAIAGHPDGPAVVHPEVLITFGERWELWPQWPSDSAQFNLGNWYDRNYWDTVCIASREVFEAHPYAPTRATPFGFEDWHWNTVTLAAGVPHLAARGTALFYRIKPGDSVNALNVRKGSVLSPTPLLRRRDVAADVLANPRPSEPPRRSRTPAVRHVLRAARKRKAPPVLARPPRRRERWLGHVMGSPVVVEHYRMLHPEVADLTSLQVFRHYRRVGRTAGLRPRLTDDEVTALLPSAFDVRHYRVLHADIAAMSDVDAIRHYLDHGLAEGRRARLSDREIEKLAELDVNDYRADNPDLGHLDRDQLVAHFLTYGVFESRRPHLPLSERHARASFSLDEELVDDWRELHQVEPLLPIPTLATLRKFNHIGPPADGSDTIASRVWWQLVDALGDTRPDMLIFTPWMRMGGADILVGRYAQTARELRPDWQVVVVCTHDDSTTQDWMPPGVTLVDLTQLDGYDELTREQRRDLVTNLSVQFAPELVHIINSPEAYDAFEASPHALAAGSRVYLTTFVIDLGADGEMHNALMRRRPGFLDSAAGVVVDNRALADQLVEIYAFPREKFHVHHQAVELPPRVDPAARPAGQPLRVLWAARFDRQKRLDTLADVVEAAARSGLEAEWHVFGGAVMDAADDTAATLERLARSRVHLHGPYSAADPLVLGDYDAFLLTSEAEGIPLTLLDVMAARLPVVAASVGGVPELVDEETGYPVADHEDVMGYVNALTSIAADPVAAHRRAEAGYVRLEKDFSWEAFQRVVCETPGYLRPAADAPR